MTIKVADYHSRPIEEIEFPDGTVWKLRQPREEDYYARMAVLSEHQKRVKAYAHELKLRADEKRAAEVARVGAEELVGQWRTDERTRLSGTVPDEALEGAVEKAVKKRIEDAGDNVARALIEEEGDEDSLPIEVTARYLTACMVGVFIVPQQKPEVLLQKLGPDILHMLNLRIAEVLGGDAAKKRIARES